MTVGDSVPTDPAVVDVATRAATAVQARADPAALHAAALTDLLWSADAGPALDRSIASLATAARLSDRPAPPLVDLAAAYLVRAGRTQEVRDLLEAIEAADRAVEADPRNPPARFDLALAMQELGLVHEAARAWSGYLALDSTSGWAAEARRHARVLAVSGRGSRSRVPVPRTAAVLRALADSAPHQARRMGWDDCLGTWGAAVLRGDSATARRALEDARVLGERLERDGRDATLADAVRAARAVARDAGASRVLARAHVALARGRALHRRVRYGAARIEFRRAVADAVRSPPLREWSQTFLAAALLYGGRPATARRLLDRVLAESDSTREPALRGRARWILGTIDLRAGTYEAALHEYRAAHALLSRAGERSDAAATLALAADASFALGEWDSGFAFTYAALHTLRPGGDSVWTHTVLDLSSTAAAAIGLPRTAVHLTSEDVVATSGTRQHVYMVEARLQRARLTARRDPARAARDVLVARRIIRTLPGSFARRWLAADADVADAVGPLRHEPMQAIVALDSAIRTFSSVGSEIRLLPALLVRADARLSGGDVRGGERDLDRVTLALRAEDDRIRSATLRASLLDAARSVFDHRTMLSVDAGHVAAALQELERGRSSLGPAGFSSVRQPEGRITAPAGTVVLDYALIGDTLLTWAIRGHLVHLTRMTVSHVQLVRTIDAVRAALAAGVSTPAVRADLSMLYDRLIRPSALLLVGRGMSLVVIADGVIAGAPIAALYDSVTRRYLVEMHPVSLVPRLGEVRSVRARPTTRRASILLVGQPAIDGRRYPGLGPLPGVHPELRAVDSQYPGAHILEGAAAEPHMVEELLPGADILHFAGHAVFDADRPDSSFLLLAPGPDGNDRLTAAAIAHLDLHRMQLVVLSACETLRPDGRRSGAIAGLAQAFLSAGARGVVGAEWPIDDRVARTIMAAFHEAYRARRDAAEALRAAQIRMIHAHDPALRSPSAWGGLRYAGN